MLYFHDQHDNFYTINKISFKTINTHWNVNGFAKNRKESTMVIAFLPVVTAEEKETFTSLIIYLQCKNMKQSLILVDTLIIQLRVWLNDHHPWCKQTVGTFLQYEIMLGPCYVKQACCISSS